MSELSTAVILFCFVRCFTNINMITRRLVTTLCAPRLAVRYFAAAAKGGKAPKAPPALPAKKAAPAPAKPKAAPKAETQPTTPATPKDDTIRTTLPTANPDVRPGTAAATVAAAAAAAAAETPVDPLAEIIRRKYPNPFPPLPPSPLAAYKPRQYPFPLHLATDIIREGDMEFLVKRPHDIVHYKSKITVDIYDLPLTGFERRIFRLIVGLRTVSDHADIHTGKPLPPLIRAEQKLTRHRRLSGRQVRHPSRVYFTSRALPSAQMTENAAFNQLDESIRQSKIIARELSTELEKRITDDETFDEEVLVRERAYDVMIQRLYEQRQQRRAAQTSSNDGSPLASSTATEQNITADGNNHSQRESVTIDRKVDASANP